MDVREIIERANTGERLTISTSDLALVLQASLILEVPLRCGIIIEGSLCFLGTKQYDPYHLQKAIADATDELWKVLDKKPKPQHVSIC